MTFELIPLNEAIVRVAILLFSFLFTYSLVGLLKKGRK